MRIERRYEKFDYDNWRINALGEMIGLFGEEISPWFGHMEKDLRPISHPMGERQFVNMINGLLEISKKEVNQNE